MATNILQTALGEIEKKRKENMKKAELNYQAMMQSKEFSDNEYEIKKAIFELGKARFEKNDKLMQTLLKNMEKLTQKRKSILKKHNLTESVFYPKFSCQKCNDTGYINDKMCTCLTQLVLTQMELQSGLGTRKLNTFADCDFSQLDEASQKHLQSIFDKMVTYSEKFPTAIKKPNLLFQGQSGSGKTFIINAVASRLIERGFTVLYATAFSLNNLFAKYHTTFDSDRQLYMDNLINCDLLIIDDLGTEPNLANVTQEYLYSVINERTVTGKGFAISTNLTLKELLERYGERTASRIFNKQTTTTIPFKVMNIRTIKT